MKRYLFRPKRAISNQLLAVLAVVLLLGVGDIIWHPSQLHRYLTWPVVWLERNITRGYESMAWLANYQHTLASIRQANAELQQQKLFSTWLQVQLQPLQAENQQLRTFLHMTKNSQFDWFVVSILRNEINLATHQFIIALPISQQSIYQAAVVVPSGLVGTVQQVTASRGWVRLLSDAQMVLPVQLQRTKLPLIIHGQGYDKPLLIDHLPIDSNIQPGDLVETSGLGGHYPTGLLVGQVISVDHEANQPFLQAKVHQSAKPQGWRFVLVIPLSHGKKPDHMLHK